MKTYVSDLAPGAGKFTSFFVLVKKEIREASNNKPYLSCTLKDKTGEVDGRQWDTNSCDAELESVVKVQASAEAYKGKVQLRIEKLRAAAEIEYDLGDMLPTSARPPEVMMEELLGLIDDWVVDPFKEWLTLVIGCNRVGLERSPASKFYHHAFIGGLLEHILGIAHASVAMHHTYPELNISILIAAAVCHDIGKLRELSSGLGFGYTTEGKLHGHVLMGFEQLASARILPDQFGDHLLHIIASHHGQIEHGAAVMPQTREAIVFHHLDMVDSRLAAARAAIAAAPAEDEFTPFVPILKAPLWKGKQCPKTNPEEAASAEIPPPCPQPRQQELLASPGLPANYPE